MFLFVYKQKSEHSGKHGVLLAYALMACPKFLDFAPRTGHEFICETSHVLLAGVSGGFFSGYSGFRPTYRLIRLDMSEKA